MNRIFRIARAVADTHKGQTREGGQPFVRHPFNVARRVAKRYYDPASPAHFDLTESMIVVALCHDVYEDTDRWPNVRSLLYSHERDAVLNLSDNFEVDNYHDYIKRLEVMPRWVRAVKVEDRLDNLTSAYNEWPMNRVARYAIRSAADILPLAHDLHLAKKELRDWLMWFSNKVTSNVIVTPVSMEEFVDLL